MNLIRVKLDYSSYEYDHEHSISMLFFYFLISMAICTSVKKNALIGIAYSTVRKNNLYSTSFNDTLLDANSVNSLTDLCQQNF